MSKWLLLHHNRWFTTLLAKKLGQRVVAVDIKTLLDNTTLVYDGRCFIKVNGEFINLEHMIICHDVFYKIKGRLWLFHPKDHDYVVSAWQSYLLYIFRRYKTLNPIVPQHLTSSFYQIKTQQVYALKFGLNIPRIALFDEPNYASVGYEYLWFQPHAQRGSNLYVEMKKSWRYIGFVYHTEHGLWTTEGLPQQIKQKVGQLIKHCQLHYGELYMQYDQQWWFYGLCPEITENQYSIEKRIRLVEQLLRWYDV
jgi:hypothetical protein